MGRDLTPEERYAALVQVLRGMPDVTEPEIGSTRAFGADALKVHGKIFAMLTHGRLVVKLPRVRVEALIAAGTGTRFDPGHGRLMKEWLSVAPDEGLDWLSLAREALEYVGARR